MLESRILIVDDEPTVAKILKEKLKILGYTQPSIATSGEEALRQISENLPDLILMDILLSGKLDGIETAELIHSQWDIPIIYITALDDEDTLQRAKITDPLGYIIKPFSERELHSAIQIALYKAEMTKQLKESEARFKSIVQDLTEFVCRYSPDGILTFVNEALCQYFEKPYENLVGTDFFALIPEEERQEIKELVLSLQKENPVVTIVHHIMLPDGNTRLHQWRVRCLCDDQDEVIQYQAVGWDITG